jgi:N-hydroxyarylamine O-acetyltransferase
VGTQDADTLTPSTRERVLETLGVTSEPDLDLDGLGHLYRAWCACVPFDNIRKLIALAGGTSDRLPGDSAEDFFASWLQHGTGGTCWPGANALHALAASVGFTSRRVAASMWELGEPTHGTTVVTVDGDDYLLDSSMLTDTPLRLHPDDSTRIDHPVFAATAEPVAEGWRFEFSLPYAPSSIPCRTMGPEAVDHPFFQERYEVSRTSSPFNGQPTVRRNQDGTVCCVGGATLYVRSADGIDECPLDGEALRTCLVERFALSEQIVDTLLSVWTPEPAGVAS